MSSKSPSSAGTQREQFISRFFIGHAVRNVGWQACAGLFLAMSFLLLPSAVARAQEPGSYVIGPSDVLSISVYDNPQLTGRYSVQTDGTLAFPLIGTIKASGLSLQALQNDLRDRLARGYLRDPQVGVTVDQYRSQRVFVMGEVRQPGGFEFTGTMTVIEALARAGSTTERAGSRAIVVRPTTSTAVVDVAAVAKGAQPKDADVIRVDLERLQEGALAENVTLRGGDTLFVGRADTVFVSGHVNSAGEFAIRRGMTVRQVLSLAGGVTDRGSTRRIQVIRLVNGVETTVGVTLQDPVQPGDTIVVRERFF